MIKWIKIVVILHVINVLETIKNQKYHELLRRELAKDYLYKLRETFKEKENR